MTTQPAPASPSYEQLDPATLLVDRNLREVRADDDFRRLVGSVRDLGVLQPVTVHRTADGDRVLFGHRRTLAAVEAGLTLVPALVHTGDTVPDSEAAEVDRILGQHAENTHRAPLTTAENIAAFGQLAAHGQTPARIARRTRTPRAAVDAALAAASSEVATKATTRWEFLSLDDAAALAEFDDDPDAVKAIVTAARDGRSTAHVAQQLRDQRDTAQAIDALTAALTESGVPVIAQPAYDEPTIRRLGRLHHDGQPLDPGSHADCPGHAAYVTRSHGPERAEAVHVCVHPRIHGHTDLTAHSGSTSGPLTEAEKADRKRVRDNNDAWRSAETVRRAWLRDFLTRRTPPKGTAVFVATALAHGDHALSRAFSNGGRRARDLFRLDPDTDEPNAVRSGKALTDLADGATDARALVVALGLVLAAHEDAWTTDTWRRPTPADARYLGHLIANGYQPAEVEQLVLGAPLPQPDQNPDDSDSDDDPADTEEDTTRDT